VHLLQTAGTTSNWLFPVLKVAGVPFAPGGPISVHTLIDKERAFTVFDAQWGNLTTITDLEDEDVSDLVQPDCTLGDTQVSLETYLEDPTYYLTSFEYTKDNNSKGLQITLPAPEGGWQPGWNTVITNALNGNYLCDKNAGCTTICDTPWDQMNRLQLYRSGPKTGAAPVEIKIRNVRLTKFGAVGSNAVGKNVAIIDNPMLPQCLVAPKAGQWADAGLAVSTQGNLEGCTCEGDPVTVECPPPTPPEDPDPPGNGT
jgi:hypothetical protein